MAQEHVCERLMAMVVSDKASAPQRIALFSLGTMAGKSPPLFC